MACAAGNRQLIADTDNRLSPFRHEIDKGIVTFVNERPPRTSRGQFAA